VLYENLLWLLEPIPSFFPSLLLHFPEVLCELLPSSTSVDIDICNPYLATSLGQQLQKGNFTPQLAGMHKLSEPELTNPVVCLCLR